MDYKTTYKIRSWNSIEELELLLNEMVNDEWRIDTHKVSERYFRGLRGWTIFSKTVKTGILIERDIRVGEVYKILNSILPEDDDNGIVNLIDKQIKKYFKRQDV